MTYKELLEMTKKNPGCLWTKEQRNADSEYKFTDWMKQQEQDNRKEKEKEKNKNKNYQY